MAFIEMNYILIDKKTDDNKNARQIALEYLKKSGFVFEDGKIIVDAKNYVTYRFDHKRGSNRYYLSLSANMRINNAWLCLEKLDSCLGGEINRLVAVTKSFDGLSASYCEKLYPRFGTFERKVRQLIILVLTKAFGDNWVNETIPKEKQDELKAKAKGKLNTREILEQFDLAELEAFLFAERELDYKEFLQNDLGIEKLGGMTKEEIVDKLREMRPKSLWSQNFADIGNEQSWKTNILSIHDCRNKIAHHKSINRTEYIRVVKTIKGLNKDLDEAIANLQHRDFTDENRVDILSGFKAMAGMNIRLSELFSLYDFSALNKSITMAVQNAVNISASVQKIMEAANRINPIIQSIAASIPPPDVLSGISRIALDIPKIEYPTWLYDGFPYNAIEDKSNANEDKADEDTDSSHKDDDDGKKESDNDKDDENTDDED